MEDAKKLGVDDWYCLGDVVGYGPDAHESVEVVMNQFRQCIYGNHEKMLETIRSKKDAEDYVPTVGRPLEIAWQQLRKTEAWDWLTSLQLSAKIDDVVMLHAAPYRPERFTYVLNEEDAAASFESFNEAIAFNGHSHVPIIWEQSEAGIRQTIPREEPIPLYHSMKHIINVGSVGQPRDDDPRACYAIFDAERQVVWFRRVTYDIERAQQRFKDAGLPSSNWKRLRLGQ
jgi:diadenosine tetraphosphatase ApaH/serine/threonine PP2A family protein phosphatase